MPGAHGTGASKKNVQSSLPDTLLQARIKRARDTLKQNGMLGQPRSKRLSVQVAPVLLEAARQRSGIQSNSELVTAALELMAAGEHVGDLEFGRWLISQKGRLSEDFELPI